MSDAHSFDRFLGHVHRGRQFASNIHASFASSLMSMLALQAALGVYLKLHLENGFHGRVRSIIVSLHGVLGKAIPVVSWVQMLFGGITACVLVSLGALVSVVANLRTQIGVLPCGPFGPVSGALCEDPANTAQCRHALTYYRSWAALSLRTASS